MDMKNFMDIEQKIAEHINTPAAAKDPSANEGKMEESVKLISQMFPSLSSTADVNQSTIPEYGKDANVDESDEGSEKSRKKITQNMRLKQTLQEKEQLLAQQARKIDEMALALGKINQRADELAYTQAETEEKLLNFLKSDLHYTKQHYEIEQNFDDARKAEEELYNIHNKVDKIKRDKQIYAQKLDQTKYLVSAAEQEFQTKQYNAQSSYEFEEDDESKIKAKENFFKTHSFLDPSNNNPNYSPRLFQMAQDLSVKLEDQYKINKRGKDVGSPHFYSDLSNLLKSSLNDDIGGNSPDMNTSFYRNPSQNYSAPVTSSKIRSGYTPPMSESERRIRENMLNQFGVDKAETYDEIFKTYKRSM